ncbi:MAG: DUF5017 domain-containing protein [Bacteroidales bacterium]|nr:DUF5017 domain-containing protein [Bacteroidales bacterium]
MKLYKYSLFLLAGAALFASCDDKEATQPTAAISVDKYVYDVNESMTLRFIGSADNVVVYPGDEDQDYELRDQSNTGLVVNKGLLTYAYQKPGIYHVVCVATNHEDAGKSFLQDTTSVWIKVIDEVVDIDKLSATAVIYDEVYADQINDTDWMLPIPRKLRYNKKDVTVNLKKQKLGFYIESSTTTVETRDLDDETSEYGLHNSSKYYDLEKNLHIRTTSSSGMTREYNLFTLNYGEFKTISIGGVTGKLERTEYDYSYYWVDAELPADGVRTALPVEFTLYDPETEKVYVGDKEVNSGDVFDFTEPVTFRFVVTEPGREHIKVESTCVVTVN